jgi:hypothetical protein
LTAFNKDNPVKGGNALNIRVRKVIVKCMDQEDDDCRNLFVPSTIKKGTCGEFLPPSHGQQKTSMMKGRKN